MKQYTWLLILLYILAFWMMGIFTFLVIKNV